MLVVMILNYCADNLDYLRGHCNNHNDQIIIMIRYYTGDLVNVTCYSRGSSPPANLHWKVNNERVFDEVADMEQYR